MDRNAKRLLDFAADLRKAEDVLLEQKAQIILMAAEIEEQKPRWISVEERVPAWGEHVIVFAGFFQPFMEIAYYDEDKKWRFAYDDTEVPLVTHWMPLPQPPKEE